MEAHSAKAMRRHGALAVLRYAHDQLAPVTRAECARELGLSSGSAAEIVTRLKQWRLLGEGAAPVAAVRGRPSPRLVPHPDGPLVCAADLGYERWQVAVVELGGRVVEQHSGRIAARPGGAERRAEADVLGPVRDQVIAARRQAGDRLRAVGVSVAGTVQGTAVVQAASTRLRGVDLTSLLAGSDLELVVRNDASLAGLAEARRGAGAGARLLLHLTVEVGVGGILVSDGVPVAGATGAGGEFGHLPFGDPAVRCPCGAYGCWDPTVDGRGMARALGLPAPRNPRTKAGQVIAAGVHDPAARRAVLAVTRSLGRGLAGLVNALDPDRITIGGLATDLAAFAPDTLQQTYRAGLMRFRRSEPPPLTVSALGDRGALIGAAEAAFDTVLTDAGLERWLEAHS